MFQMRLKLLQLTKELKNKLIEFCYISLGFSI